MQSKQDVEFGYIKMNELRFWRSIGNLALALRPATRISGARVLLLRSALPTRFVYNFIILVSLIHSFLLLIITAAASKQAKAICLQDSFIHSCGYWERFWRLNAIEY